ncbi:hypothetical protein Nepgr_004287 [Nepenthes gracilis]|uniref:Uncharacterized protein n=1 Tax=Nepenthes gracilis TaxID=150966 RepID=A0AAD3S162_NEPGR|nr:hypothetical protein Nepgr_004287 [Nepenthes gracilis]
MVRITEIEFLPNIDRKLKKQMKNSGNYLPQSDITDLTDKDYHHRRMTEMPEGLKSRKTANPVQIAPLPAEENFRARRERVQCNDVPNMTARTFGQVTRKLKQKKVQTCQCRRSGSGKSERTSGGLERQMSGRLKEPRRQRGSGRVLEERRRRRGENEWRRREIGERLVEQADGGVEWTSGGVDRQTSGGGAEEDVRRLENWKWKSQIRSGGQQSRLNFNVRVLETDLGSYALVEPIFDMEIDKFCSKSGQWSKLIVNLYPRHSNWFYPNTHLVADDNKLHLINPNGVLVFDPFADAQSFCHVINGPPAVGATGDNFMAFGVSQGRLRVAYSSYNGPYVNV